MFCFDTKVAIVGAGNVGSTLAYTCMLQGLASQIVLIDVDEDRALGQASDMNHCQQFTPNCYVSAGSSFELVAGAAIVIITAGIAQRPGQSRADLVQENTKLFASIIPKIVSYNKDCFLLVVTNPMDVLSYVTYKLSGFPAERVIGSGTVLDTARLRFLLAKYFSVSAKDVSAYVLGEHGDSEFIYWSGASIAGSSIALQAGYTAAMADEMLLATRRAAYEIIEQKGATYYAIALAVAKIIKAIMFNQKRVFTLSTLVTDVIEHELYLSLPLIVSDTGHHRRLPLTLSTQERTQLLASATNVYAGIEVAQTVLNTI